LQHGGDAAAAGGSLVRRRPPDGWLSMYVLMLRPVFVCVCCVGIAVYALVTHSISSAFVV
jgi:hypothetical protein